MFKYINFNVNILPKDSDNNFIAPKYNMKKVRNVNKFQKYLSFEQVPADIRTSD